MKVVTATDRAMAMVATDTPAMPIPSRGMDRATPTTVIPGITTIGTTGVIMIAMIGATADGVTAVDGIMMITAVDSRAVAEAMSMVVGMLSRTRENTATIIAAS